MNPQAFVFIGRSGCGKGTQAHLLKPFIEKTGLPVFYVETGDMFRSFIEKKGYSNKLSDEIYVSGERQPDFLGALMWSKRLTEEMETSSHLLLDGVARSVNEAKLLETAFSFYKIEKAHIIYLNVSREWAKERLLNRGRNDDRSEQSIEKRLDWFERDVLPAIEYFKNSQNHFMEISGEASIEKVHSDIVSGLSEFVS